MRSSISPLLPRSERCYFGFFLFELSVIAVWPSFDYYPLVKLKVICVIQVWVAKFAAGAVRLLGVGFCEK